MGVVRNKGVVLMASPHASALFKLGGRSQFVLADTEWLMS